MSDLKVKNIREVAIGEINELIGEINNDFYREFCFAGFNQLLDDISTLKSLRKTFNMPEKIDGIKNRVTIRDVSSVLCSITNDNDTVDDENDLVVFGKLNYLFGFEPIYLLLSSSIPFKEQIYKSGMTTLTNYFKDENIQIENLFELSDGFLNGEGKAPPIIGLLRFFNDFNNNYDYKLPMPNFFPTVDGNILLEWKKDNYDISLEVNLKTFESTYNILNLLDPNDDINTIFNLIQKYDWEALVNSLKKDLSNDVIQNESFTTNVYNEQKFLNLEINEIRELRQNIFYDIINHSINLSKNIKNINLHEYLSENLELFLNVYKNLSSDDIIQKIKEIRNFIKGEIFKGKLFEDDYFYARMLYALFNSSLFVKLAKSDKEQLMVKNSKSISDENLNGLEKSDNDIYIVNEYKNQPILKKILSINNLNIRNSLIDKYEQLIIISDDKENDNIEEMENRSDKIYFNKIIKFPFDISSELNKDIGKFYNEINNTHYGMLNVKTKIAEILASQNRNSNSNLPVICLVGSPGVGKTSLVHSICNALNRKLYKISLNDSPDIYSLLSGFSSTYKSSTNGRISQSFLDTGVNNPVILLDEIDKAIKSQSGDVSNGLLSVIDPTQNKNYYDSYFGFGIDLSKVFFICTANSLAEISPPLLDRMVVINVDGYSNNEKLNILKNHSIPKVFKNNGISNEELLFHDDILEFIILNYSSESGMRSLESIIDSLCKKFIFQKDVLGNNININFDNIDSLLENNSIIKENAHRNSVGYVNGLYVSDNGGGITKVESIITDGDGKICDLGLLGDMMKNSIQVIYNLLKSNDKNWNLPKDFFKNNNICVSLGGSRNVDGPSAGTAIVCSILSSIQKINIPNNIAMTGEIDLHGNVLPIGGCREKILGGKREGVNKFFFPIGNENDIKKLEDEIKNGIEIKLVKNISEILYELGLRR